MPNHVLRALEPAFATPCLHTHQRENAESIVHHKGDPPTLVVIQRSQCTSCGLWLIRATDPVSYSERVPMPGQAQRRVLG